MWANKGNSSFSFNNSSSKEVTVLLDRSFLIVNGYAYPLYSEMEQTYSEGQSSNANVNWTQFNRATMFNQAYWSQVGVSQTETSGSSTTYISKPSFIIPSNSSRIVYSPQLVNELIVACEMNKTPRKLEEVTTFSYTKDNSPYVYESSISFMVEGEDSVRILRPSFYVSSVKNISSSMMYKSEQVTNCDGYKEYADVNVESSPHKFFVRYSPY